MELTKVQIEEKEDLEKYAPDVDLPIDPEIRELVLILRREKVETFESCQGGEGHCALEPFIRFFGNIHEGYRAFAIAMTYGYRVRSIAYEATEVGGWLENPSWMMRLRSTHRD